MADDQVILTHYGVATQFPTQWPTEKDDSEGSEAEGDKQEKPRRPDINNRVQNRRSKSRYSILERAGTQRRSVVPGAERTKDGVENLVQKDEADPLGAPDSVVRALRQKAIRVEDDQQLKNRFLLSSTTFTPALYLSQVHSDTSTQALLHGLDYLTRSIDKKSASLKVLVESNFERFVKAKSTIDNVYTQMRKEGIEDEPEVEKPRVHSRHSSKTSTHFRSASGQGAPNRGLNKPLPTNRKKHALTKESEYGILGIKAPLIEVNVKAEEVWGPALGGREREENLRSLVKSFEGCQSICAAEAAVSDCIKRKDYENLIQEFIKARQYADDARKIARTSLQNNIQLTESQVNQIVITGRMWQDVEVQLESFKREIWRKLTSVQANMAMSTDRNYQDDHMALISVLLELGVEDNPIWVWLLSRYDYLKNKINQTSDRSRMEIEVLRRQLANGDPPTSHAVALHLRTSIRTDAEQRIKSMDTPPILELWELIVASLNSLLSMHGGILGEVVDFWNKTQSFIDGKAQKTLPIGVDGNSMKHHRLSTDGVRDLQNGAAELVELLREHVCSFFADPPIEDISMIFSPAPTNAPNTPKSAPLSPYPLSANRLRFNLTSPPPPSPKRGEPWEDFAFWPPYANSVSGVHYLNVALTLLGTAAGEMAAMRPMATERSGVEKLKLVVSGARERCARALCAAWNRDAELCKVLEDWTREPERRDLTKMPARFASFEATVLCGMQKVVYLSEAGAKSKSSDVIALPPTKLLQMIRSQFVTSLYKALSGMVENAEKPVNATADAWAIDQGSMDNTIGGTGSTGDDRDKIDTSNRALRMLLTLSNLKRLQNEIVPQLISQFETNFSVKLSDESKTIHDVLSQIDARLFQSYTRPTVDSLASITKAGISSPTWVPPTTRPTEVKPYIYQVLLVLVFVHTEVSTTAQPLTTPILSHLLEQTSTSLLDAFRSRPTRYILPALMQATLDIEFVAQTLSQYTTERASQTQSQIYLELDQRTDSDARTRLQNELPEMRAVLKKLRERTRGEFACFKKVRSTAAAADRERGRGVDRERKNTG